MRVILLKKTILYFVKKINQLLYREYDIDNCPHSQLLILKLGFFQKILGINRKVKWPVHPTSTFIAPEKIIPGTRTPGLAKNCFFDARNGIVIGKNVWIAHGVNFISQDHSNIDYNQYKTENPIVIGDNCLIGANSIILPGVQLGEHTIVGAGSVVTKSFLEGNIIIAGNPAKIVKKIGEYKCVV